MNLKTVIISLVISIVLTIANIAYANVNNRLLFNIYTMYGGECIIDYGFGCRLTAIYSMLPDGTTSYKVSFSIIMFIVGLSVVFLSVLILGKIFSHFNIIH